MLNRSLFYVIALSCFLLLVAGCGAEEDDDFESGTRCDAGADCADEEDGGLDDGGFDDGGRADGGSADGGAEDGSDELTCEEDEWLDDGECRQCLAAALDCSSLVLGDPPGESYFWSGAATQSDPIDPRVVLTLDADVEIEALEGAKLDVETISTTQVGDVPEEVTREATIDGRQLTFSFDPGSDWIEGGNPSGLRVLALEVTDTCGQTGEQEIGGTFTVLSTERQYNFQCPPEGGE